MTYLLQLDSSANLNSSASRRLTAEAAELWVSGGADREIRRRDLHVDPLPHLPTNALHFIASRRPADAVAPSPEIERLQDELLDELAGAAVVLIGSPMYNFSMPSTLKAWLDYVHVIGANSPVGEGINPLRSKPVTVISARSTPTGEDPRTDFCLLYTSPSPRDRS